MLSAADTPLVERDPGIPALGLLLDPDAFGALLVERYPQGLVESVRPTYVRYKPQTSCLVGYEIETAGGPTRLYARAHNLRGRDKLQKAAQRDGVSSLLKGGIETLAELAVVIYPFPNDHELRALRELAVTGQRASILERVLPDTPALWMAEPHTLGYKPERRWVARVGDADADAAVLRHYTKADFSAGKDNTTTFESAGSLVIARRLGRSRRSSIAAVEWISGRPLKETLTGPGDLGEACGVVGAALACLHRQKHTFATTLDQDTYVRTLADAGAAVAETSPALGDRAAAIARHLGDYFTKRHWRARRSIHGDFSADQVILTGNAAAFLDLDRSSRGDPRIDLATFRAKLDYDVLAGRLDSARSEACFDALLEAYRAESDKDVTRKLDRYVAAGLLQLAVEPFRHRHPDWPAITEAVVGRAEALAFKTRTEAAS